MVWSVLRIRWSRVHRSRISQLCWLAKLDWARGKVAWCMLRQLCRPATVFELSFHLTPSRWRRM